MALALFTGSTLTQGAVVAEWNFNEIVNGTTLADQIGTINGTINTAGASSEMTTVPSGAGVPGSSGFGNAYYNSSSSTSTHINMGTTASTSAISNFGTDAFTIAGWFDVDERNSGSNDRWLIGNTGTSGGFVIYIRKGDNSNRGKLCVTVGGGTGAITLTSTARVDLTADSQQWHWFAATSDGSALTLWLDGTRVASVAYLATTTATPDIGTTTMVSRALNGKMDQLTIWNQQLTGTTDGNNTLTSGSLYNLWQQGTAIPEPGTTGMIIAGLIATIAICFKRYGRRERK